MAGFINSQDQLRRATRVVSALHSRMQNGVATEEEVERYRAGVDHILIYEWAEEGKRQTQERAKAHEQTSAESSWEAILRGD